jgi:hypothetical protein
MSTPSQGAPQPIYALLPSIYRARDDLLGDPLASFYSVLESQYAIVKDNLLQLYDDQSIETCAPWVIPYIGALIGFDPAYTVALAGADSRAEVANTIGYRRRKGTRIALEQMTHDVSGRTTMAIEEFRRLITTLSLRDVRKNHSATAELRRGRDWEDQFGPFTRLNRLVDVRRIAPRLLGRSTITSMTSGGAVPPDSRPLDIAMHGPGRYNIPDIAVWMWRWQSWTVSNAPAFSLAATGNSSGYQFSTLGGPIPLFQAAVGKPQPFTRLTHQADVPEPIRRRRFARHIGEFYPSNLQLVSDGVAVPLSQVTCANLEPGPGGELCTVPAGMIAIDPCLGRIQYAAGLALPSTLRVSYNFGSPAPFAGGPYDRTASINQQAGGPLASGGFLAVIGASVIPAGYTSFATLQAAVAAWNLLPAGSAGTIVLPNFESISGVDLTGANAIQIPAQSQLLVASAEITAGGAPPLWNQSCVTLIGNLEIFAPSAPLSPGGVSAPMGSLQMSGLWLSGAITLSGAAACVQVTDCTLVPGIRLNPDGSAAQAGTPNVTGTAIGASFSLTRSICGPIVLPPSSAVRICSSVLDSGSPSSLAFTGPAGTGAPPLPGAELHIEDSTVIGKVYAQAIRLASNTIFHSKLAASDSWNAAVWAHRTQVGCIRYCSLPWNSIVPRRFECLPPDAASQEIFAPHFVCLNFGDPAYCLLSGDCPVAVWKGADNGSQMGVYLQVQETEAVANIQIRANEYLVANLECGVFLIPSRSRGWEFQTRGDSNPVSAVASASTGKVSVGAVEGPKAEQPQATLVSSEDRESQGLADPEPPQADEGQHASAGHGDAEAVQTEHALLEATASLGRPPAPPGSGQSRSRRRQKSNETQIPDAPTDK